ncbi:pyruvate kinase [Luteithermobacter gelatinilyticus]|uniref:pyruvate kinase n=1 Tax=Luteithermobacter gelatinilyticus TaxID=2582913 RepID=UPI001106ACE8|nr:pyruvate kinase [Luteithermobacter gelatinilyticus]|tara:strand:+ start:5954 stop:7387 length:1434 start_codon:yes stop_codon:yes gene_type:complete
MHRQRCTRIIATLGPASSSVDIIRKLSDAGADVFRLNMSHGDHKSIAALHAMIREVEVQTGRPIGILADLQGPKLRIGKFQNDRITLAAGQKFILDMDKAPGSDKRVELPHPEIFEAVEKGTELLLDDGKIRLHIEQVEKDKIHTKVVVGGELSNRKGVNVPNAILPLAALTEKDRNDLDFVLNLGVDWVGLSFVQRPEDMREAREIIGERAWLLAKLEKPSALYALDEIIALSDAVMVARGDMGVELPMEEVPGKQKKIIRHARRAGKSVVVATQMLETMVHSPVPTRAEVSDVANAVFDGADAIMLSAESATGAYPVEAVSVMDRIARKVESEPSYRKALNRDKTPPEATSADAISAAANQVAATIRAKTIVTYTGSGSTALRASRERPETPLLVLTPNLSTARRLCLCWGLNCVHTADAVNFQDMIDKACHMCLTHNFARVNDHIVIMAGMPFGTPGKTNVLRIARVQSYHKKG